MSRAPDVTVVVAVLNAEGTLRSCIDSVAAQRGVGVQLLVADGGSADGTLEVIRSREQAVDWWDSGPDSGVYAAWNKALPRASGRWICFLGADDRFAGETVLRRLVEEGDRSEADLVCSRVRYPGGKVVGQPWEWSKMVRFMCVAHPGMLHRRQLFDRFGNFSEHYRIAGDYEFLLRLGPAATAAFVDEPVVEVGGTGLSSRTLPMLREMRLVQQRHPDVGPVRAQLNFAGCLAEQAAWRVLEALPFELPGHPLVRAAGGALGLHRHDYGTGGGRR